MQNMQAIVICVYPTTLLSSDNTGNWDADELNKRVTGAYKSLQVFIQGVAAEPFLTDVLSGTTNVLDVVLTTSQVDDVFTQLEQCNISRNTTCAFHTI